MCHYRDDAQFSHLAEGRDRRASSVASLSLNNCLFVSL